MSCNVSEAQPFFVAVFGHPNKDPVAIGGTRPWKDDSLGLLFRYLQCMVVREGLLFRPIVWPYDLEILLHRPIVLDRLFM